MRESTRKVRRLALSAMMTALGVVILYLGCFFETLDLTVAAIASFCVVLILIEMGGRYALAVYIGTTLLSLLLLPQKLIAVEYTLFAGCYPLVKMLAERLKPLFSWLIKLLFANLSLTLLMLVIKFIFSMPIEQGWMLIATYALVNVTVVIFDIALSKLMTLYCTRLQKRLAGLFKGTK